MMNDALAKLHEHPWLASRPTLGLLVTVKDMAHTYVLANDGLYGGDQRASFADAATRYAMPIRFPAQAELPAAAQSVAEVSAAEVEQLKRAMHAEQILLGSLQWDAKALGWVGEWRLASGPDTRPWHISGVNFDAAFRNAVGGAAKRLRPQEP